MQRERLPEEPELNFVDFTAVISTAPTIADDVAYNIIM
tara:strand:+ start:1969 stop:2082 length:114 start_codon:yes stop_codon:yes gene_type:complete